MDQLFSKKDVCRIFAISPATLQRRVASGEFPAPKPIFSTGCKRWMRSDLNEVFERMASEKVCA